MQIKKEQRKRARTVERVRPLIVRAVGGCAESCAREARALEQLYVAFQKAGGQPAMHVRCATRISVRARGGSRALRVGHRGRAASETSLDGEKSEAQRGRGAMCGGARGGGARGGGAGREGILCGGASRRCRTEAVGRWKLR
jgi:hypothetical protein